MNSFKEFASFLGVSAPTKEQIDAFEEEYMPLCMSILQKSPEFFSEPRVVFGVQLTPSEELWKHLQSCLFASLFHGDVKAKVSSIIETLKGYWTGAGKEMDEIEKIIGDEESHSKFGEILEFLMESRLATMMKKLIEEIDISDLELNFEDPAGIIEMMKNPEHPTIQKITKKVQTILEDKMRKGEITKEIIVSEFEMIKVKLQEAFGDMFNDALGGRRAELPANVLMGNSPEARRARMLARLQRKYKEKK